MKKDHPCFAKMIKPLSSQSQESYSYKIQKFMRFTTEKKYVKHVEDFESLLTFDSEKITDIMESYINFLESQELTPSTVNVSLTPIELFFEMNRKIWHKKLVRRSIQKSDRIAGGKDPATNDDISMMLSYCERSLRKQAIILFLASTGIRPGAIVDPVLRLKHLKWMPNPENPENDSKYCYCVQVYDNSNEGYWAFLTPESSQILTRYFDGRKQSGEYVTPESPIFVTNGSRWNSKYDHLTDDNLKMIISKVIKGAKIPRVKEGNTYNKSIIYMFRKRFNTILKINNNVNSNIAEKLMAHKKGLDGTYLQPTREECFAEFVKAISDLTIDSTERQKIEITKKQQKIKELEAKSCIIDEQEHRIKQLEGEEENKESILVTLQNKIESMEQNQADEQKRFEQWYQYMESQKEQQLEDEILRRDQSNKVNSNS